MTRSEVAKLLALIAAFDSRTIGQADVEAWHLVVGDLGADDSVSAVTAYYRDKRERIMPSDVRSGVKAIRAERLRHEPPLGELMGDIAGSDPNWNDILRQRRQSIANGAFTLKAVQS